MLSPSAPKRPFRLLLACATVLACASCGSDGDDDGDGSDSAAASSGTCSEGSCDSSSSGTDPTCVAAHPGGACEVTSSCGCADGLRCVLPLDAVETCVPPGASPLGGRCDEDEDCVAGAVCGGHVCLALCGACGDPHQACLSLFHGDAPAGYSACTTRCNPLDPTYSDGVTAICPSGQKCVASTHTYGATVCVAVSAQVPLGGACETSSDCVAGATCIYTQAGGSQAVCTDYCIVGAGPCGDGSQCKPLTPPQAYGDVQLGACQF